MFVTISLVSKPQSNQRVDRTQRGEGSESPKRVSGQYLAEYLAETVSVKIMGFGDERNIRYLPNIR